MNTKEMREFLKDKVKTVPRSNADVEKLYNEMTAHSSESIEIVPRETGEEYTYIGAGPTPPHVIKFMGLQTFVRGQPTKVTDSRVLAKMPGNKCFVKGRIDPEKLTEQDELAAKIEQNIRHEELKIQIEMDRINRSMQ